MATLERNEENLKIMRAKYAKLGETPLAEQTVELMDARMALGEDIDALEAKTEKLRKKASITEDERKAAAREANAAMTNFVVENNIYFTAETGLWWWKENGEWYSAKPPAFNEKFRAFIGTEVGYTLFQGVMDRLERKLNRAFYGWEDRPGYLNLLGKVTFCQPVEANDYHQVFDLLFVSLGGNKLENVQHLEQLILAKVLHPQNFLLPCVVFADQGGTGKSVLVSKFLTTLFGQKNVADNLSMEMAFGKFNGPLAGKAVAFVNEAPEDQSDDKGILRVIHSPVINIEKKGRDPIEACNTALYFIGTNPKSGGYAIRLAYNDVDRRFSIMHGTKPLKWYVADAYGLSHDDDDDAGWALMVNELQHVLADPIEVGKWLHCKMREYGDVKNVKALHGADYQKQAADTVEMHTRVFDAVFKAEGFDHIRSDVLFQIYKANGGSYKNIGFHRNAVNYLERDENKDLGITYETAWPWSDIVREHARVYVKNADARVEFGKRKKLSNNDGTYISEDRIGRPVILVDVI